MNNAYVITGAHGHLGNTIIRKLLTEDCIINGLVLQGDDRDLFNNPKVNIFQGDLLDFESLEAMFKDLDGYNIVVIHTAGIVSITSKFDQKVVDVNVNGTKNIIKLSKKYKVKKLVYTSSVHAIPELPKNKIIREIDSFDPDLVAGLYAKTKAIATQAIIDANIPYLIFHPSGIIGPYDYGSGHLTGMIIDYLNGKLTSIVRGGYDFVDVRDVADGIISGIKLDKEGCYLLTNDYYTIKEIIDILHKQTKKRKITSVLPLWFAKLTAPLAELYYKLRKKPPLYTSYSLYTLNTNANFSHQKATQELNYYPRDIEDTLYDSVKFMLENNQITNKKITLQNKKEDY